MAGKKGRGASQGKSQATLSDGAAESKSTNIRASNALSLPAVVPKVELRAAGKQKEMLPSSTKFTQPSSSSSLSIVASKDQPQCPPTERVSVDAVIKVPITKVMIFGFNCASTK